MSNPEDTFQYLRDRNTARTTEWEGAAPSILGLNFAAIELGGEAGEVLNEVKKLLRHYGNMVGGTPPEIAIGKISEELADVVICADRVAATLHIDLRTALRDKFNKTSDKYGLKTRY